MGVTRKNLKKHGTGRTVLVTAGPTLEYLDPVRYLTNRSTGEMGYSIAKECLKKGFPVSLITGPVFLPPPRGAEVVKVDSASDMLKEVSSRAPSCGCLIMAAAVCDFRPAERQKRKIKKKEKMTLRLIKNKDILGTLRAKSGFVKIGFALETDNDIKNGLKKLKDKRLDLIVVNKAGGKRSPFGKSRTDYTIMEKNGGSKSFKNISKPVIARVIADAAERLMREKHEKTKQ
ncbi:MAG: phosphopantothenoylcysteine decarboxylase [Candidatus Omnitrophota bacterium]